MRLYKFKALSKINHVLDIVKNEQLYCADWKKLNDPSEGKFSYYVDGRYDEGVKSIVDEIINEKAMKRVCSLSQSFDSHLLWAHYADGFKGVAIEVDIPEADLIKVEYEDDYVTINEQSDKSPQEIAHELLSKKFCDWEYEKEYRIIQENKYYQKQNMVKQVIFGHREDRSRSKELREACSQMNIPVSVTTIDFKGKISAIPYLLHERD